MSNPSPSPGGSRQAPRQAPRSPSAAAQCSLLATSLGAAVVLQAALPPGIAAWAAVPFLAHAGTVAIQSWRRRDRSSPPGDEAQSQLGIVKAIALALEARDPYTQGHCLRVRHLSRRILDKLGVGAAVREPVEIAALLHDVGKVGVPDAILLKKGGLTPEERTRLMLHVETGVEILQPLPALRTAAFLVKHHHERFDGDGYPDGLEGEEIPFGSRVIAVADSIDAMRSSRPYRAPMSLDATIEELERASGKQLDPRIVSAAIEVIRPRTPESGARPRGAAREMAEEAIAVEST